MLELLTGTGLALAAGLNAWIPLVILGALDRFTGLVELPAPWAWLSNEWVLLVMVALLVHLAKAAARPVINTATAGVGAPIASAVEDAGSFTLAFAAILAPVLVILGIVLLAIAVVLVVRRRRRTRRARSAEHPLPAP